MPFNPGVKRLVVRDKQGRHHPCLMCGAIHIRPDAVHIIDEKEWKSKHPKGYDSVINGMPLCPNCHRAFEEILRPRLFKALSKYGAKELPSCWKTSNKLCSSESTL